MPEFVGKDENCPECGHKMSEHRIGTARDDGCWATMLHPELRVNNLGCGCQFKPAPHPNCAWSH